MKARVVVDAGICGFQSRIHAESDDEQNVTFTVVSGCAKVRAFGEALAKHGPVDAYAELAEGNSSVVLTAGRKCQTECCTGCAVPVGAFKAMQVAAGLALPKDVTLQVSRD